MNGTFLCANCEAQPLKKGQKLPDYSFAITIGDSTFRKSLREFEDRYILIDFWSKDCLDCISSMPKLLDLQKKFTNKLTILLVTSNTNEEIKKLFARFREKDKTNKWIDAAWQLPIICNDSFFVRQFPYKALPSHVWIKNSLLFVGMAYPTSATEKNIGDWVSGKDIYLDEIINRDIDPFEPITLFQAVKDDVKQYKTYSVLFNRIEFGMGASSWITNINDSATGREIGITCLNASIPELYKIAYKNPLGLGYSVPDYRFIWRTSRKIAMIPPPLYPPGTSQFYNWAKENTFCYSLRTDPSLKQDVSAVMQRDLDRWFGLKSSIVKVNTKCRVLRHISGSAQNLLFPKNNPSNTEKYTESEHELVIENLPFEQLYLSIQKISEEQKWLMPVINEVTYKGNISIRLTSKISLSNISLTDLNDQLKKYGLIIAEEFRPQDMVCISDGEN